MNEERLIKISKEQALRWYNSDNEALKQLALSAFSKKELEYIPWDELTTSIPAEAITKMYSIENVLHKLRMLAWWYNDGKQPKYIGYFLQYDPHMINPVHSLPLGFKIAKHSTVKQAGVVYFERELDLVNALRYFTLEKLHLLVEEYDDQYINLQLS